MKIVLGKLLRIASMRIGNQFAHFRMNAVQIFKGRITRSVLGCARLVFAVKSDTTNTKY